MFYATGGCNSDDPDTGDKEITALDIGAFEAQMVTVVMRQLPNCKTIFADDPTKEPRCEDRMLSYSMDMFLSSPNTDPELYAIFPMAKAVL